MRAGASCGDKPPLTSTSPKATPRQHKTRSAMSEELLKDKGEQIRSAQSNGRPGASLADAALPELVREMLLRLGEDPTREGLARTPERVQQTLEFLTKGYTEDAEDMLRGALFTVSY